MAKVTQDNRLLQIDTTLGKDILLIERFRMIEAVSRPFRIQVEAIAELTNAAQVTAAALMSKKAVIKMQVPDQATRYFHGIITRISQGGRGFEERFARFQLEIVPILSRLRERTDCRIFQNKSAPTIVKKVLSDHGVEFREALSKTYTDRDYCVQYRETDFDFVSRLLEEEGIYYFFEHSASKHVLVLADSPDANNPCPNQSEANYQDAGGFGDKLDAVTDLTVTEQLRSGLMTLREHHHQLPFKNLEVSEATSISVGENHPLEVYDFPGGYARLFNEPEKRLGDVSTEGQKIVRIRMEQEEASYKEASGSSSVRSFCSGFKFKLKEHFRQDYNIDWLLTSIEHSAQQSPSYASSEAVPHAYTNNFACIPHSVPFRPERKTRKPIVQGPHTAVVTGPAGEEIWPDKFGRVKVQFFWDREGKMDEKSSCWVRVAQPWAGKNWGMVATPRVGHEVVVEFLEGDPDQPIIVGSVYNSDNMPPYALPDSKTQTGIKSRSSMKGGAANFNEIRFEDKKGSEEVVVHAERNLSTTVEADESRSVGASRSSTIQKDDTLVVKTGNHEITIQQKDHKLTATLGNISETCSVGTHKTTALKVEVIGTTGIKLTCGASMIEMTPASISIVSPMVKINS